MPSVIINNLFKINELIKLTSNDFVKQRNPTRAEDEPLLNKNILFERKIIQIKCKYQVISQFAKKNYFLQLPSGTGWDIYWADKQFLSLRHLKSMMPYQRINYFPGMSILTNKQNLTQRLNLYRELFTEEYDFFPKTWVVHKNPIESDLPNAMDETGKDNVDNLYTNMSNTIESTQISNKEITTHVENNRLEDTNKESNPHLHQEINADKAKENKPSVERELQTRTSKMEVHNSNGSNDRETLRDLTNQPDKTKEDVSTKFENLALTLFQKHMLSLGEHLEKTKLPNEMTEQCSETNHDTKNETTERTNEIAKKTDNDLQQKERKLRELGIKTNTVLMPNLRNVTSTYNRRSSTKSYLGISGLGNVLLRDNVKNMVMELNRLNHTNTTNDNATKANKTIRRNSPIEDNDNIKDKSSNQDSSNKTDVDIQRDDKHDGHKNKADKENERKPNVTTEVEENTPIYILKPCDGCQGKGIKLAMKIDDITSTMEFDSMICQQYITNPLLWNGYKFDIRFYVLITSVKHLRIYIYNEGIVRLATEKYESPNETNIDNMYMHLTNYSINKNSENFNEDLSKQSLERMNKFLRDVHNVDLNALYARIHDIIVKTVLTGYKPILREYLDTFKNYVYREACFQLLGFDIILDSHCNPYLLEINKNASLKRPTNIDKIIKTNLTRDLFSILNLNESRLRGDILRDNLNYNTYKKHIEYEINNRGDFNMIYPCTSQEQYERYIIE
ncbi:hypothetical protein M8J77_013014 [Diaphorina citri]|nr:hypothetical protein M8J77_013014 [Diaphorina citri]